MQIILFTFLYSFLSFAGQGDTKGNGGGAWVCLDQDNKMIKAMIVDLIEAQLDGHRIDDFYSSSEIEEAIEEKLIAIDPSIHSIYLKTREDFFAHEVLFSSKLETTLDFGNLQKPDQSFCPNGQVQFQQVLTYFNNGSIAINEPVHSILDQKNRVALLLHEIIYSIRRKLFNDHSSQISRKIVALLLTDDSLGSTQNQFLKENLSNNFLSMHSQSFVDEQLRFSTPKKIESLRNTQWSCDIISLKGPEHFDIIISDHKATMITFKYQQEFKLKNIYLNTRNHTFKTTNSFLITENNSSPIKSILLRSINSHNDRIGIEVFPTLNQSIGSTYKRSQFIQGQFVMAQGLCHRIF